jgi:hypothetical protein
MIIIIMRGENFVAQLDGLDGTPVCRRTPVAHHWVKLRMFQNKVLRKIFGPKTDQERTGENFMNVNTTPCGSEVKIPRILNISTRWT